MGIAEELVSKQAFLAMLPDLYYKVREALADPEVSLQHIENLITADPALAVSVLRLANSAFYGFPRRIETLSRAISLIGLAQLENIVLTTTLATSFQGIRPQSMDMARFWRGSIRRALLCRSIARHMDEHEPERLFVLGLISDMGHLVLYQTQTDLQAIILEKRLYTLNDIALEEKALLGCDFAELGAALVTRWQLPANMAKLIRYQLRVKDADELAPEAARLNLAVSMAEALERGEKVTAATPALDPEAPEISGLDLTLMPLFAEECESQLESVTASLGLS